MSIRIQIIALLQRLQQELGMAYLFISHDLSTVRYLCSRVIVMYLGQIVEEGPVEEIFTNPKHPYTQALLSAVPIPDPALRHAQAPDRAAGRDAASARTGRRLPAGRPLPVRRAVAPGGPNPDVRGRPGRPPGRLLALPEWQRHRRGRAQRPSEPLRGGRVLIAPLASTRAIRPLESRRRRWTTPEQNPRVDLTRYLGDRPLTITRRNLLALFGAAAAARRDRGGRRRGALLAAARCARWPRRRDRPPRS